MNQKQSTSIEQMKSIINRADNSSTRITIKITETTLKKIKAITAITSVTFKNLLKDALIDTLPLFEDLIDNTDKDDASPLKPNSADENLIQKTFVITNNSNRILDNLSTLLKTNKSRLFSIIIYIHYKFNYESKLESIRKNLIIYKKSVKSIKKLMGIFGETEDEISTLFENHDPCYEELQPHPMSDQPIECFFNNFEGADIMLSNSLFNLEDAIKDCNELISISEQKNN